MKNNNGNNSINKLIKLIVTYIILLNLVNATPPQNCQQLNTINPNICDQCQVGYYPQQDKSNCNNSINNCILYSGNNCIECNGIYGVLNNICVSNIQYCKVYFNSTTCKECNTNQGYAIDINRSNCFNTIQNCKIYKNNTSCNQCQDNYSLSYDQTQCFISPTSNCFSLAMSDQYTCETCVNQYYLTDQKTCELCNKKHCLECSNDGLCKKCINDAYTLQNGKCQCNNGFYSTIDYTSSDSNNFICQECSKKCQTCQSYDKCQTCKGNNRRISNNCECIQGYIQNDITGDCKRCDKGKYQYGMNCIMNCPKGYYNNNILRSCILCDDSHKDQDQCINQINIQISLLNHEQEILLTFSEKIKINNNQLKLQDCINTSIINSNNNNNDGLMNIQQIDDQNISIQFDNNQRYNEIEFIIDNIESNCFQTLNGDLIDYPIQIYPKQFIIPPFEQVSQEYEDIMKTSVYIIGGIILLISFINIKLHSQIIIETTQIIYILYYLDLYIPYNLRIIFESLDIFNYRIINYIQYNKQNQFDIQRDNILFGYKLNDQEQQGRFYQRGGYINSFFTNGLTYIILIIFFYLFYLILSLTCLAPYPYVLAKKNSLGLSDKKQDDSNQSQRIDLIPKKDNNNNVVMLGVTSPKQITFQKEQDEEIIQMPKQVKQFESNVYEKEIFYLLQIFIHMVKISYIPLLFAVGLQLKEYSQYDQINSFGFFCAIISLIFIVYILGILQYKDINKRINQINLIEQDQYKKEQYIYQIYELKMISQDNNNNHKRMNIIKQLSQYYPLVQTILFGFTTLLITLINKNSDILLYLLIIIFSLLVVLTFYQPFIKTEINIINIISTAVILIILFGQITIKELSKSILNNNNDNDKQTIFNGIKDVSYFLISVILLFIVLSLIYYINHCYSYFKQSCNSQNKQVFPVSVITNQQSEDIETKGKDKMNLKIENLDNKPNNNNVGDISKKISPKQQMQDMNDRRKSVVNDQKEIMIPQRKLSVINQMQAHQQNVQQKQIFVAPRKSLQKLKSMEPTNSMSSINEQASTNPSSIQVIELEELQKLVKENRKMEQKLTLIQQQQQVIMKKMNQKKSNQSRSSSSSSQNSIESQISESEDNNNDNNEQKKKTSQNQSIDTILEEEEYPVHKQSEAGSRRKRRGNSQIPNTPPSLEKIKFMENEVFHFGDDIKLDNNKNNVKSNQPKIRGSGLNTQTNRKAQTMILDDNQKQIFSYSTNRDSNGLTNNTNANSNNKNNMLNNKNGNKNNIKNQQSSSSSESQDDEDDHNFWKYSRKEQLRKDKFSRAQSMIYN